MPRRWAPGPGAYVGALDTRERLAEDADRDAVQLAP